MIAKAILYMGESTILICDGRCNKAWGVNNRPKEQLSTDEDDFEYFADYELGNAPLNPGTYEGGDGKPINTIHRLNKWCARECERSRRVNNLEKFELLDFSKRIKNKR